MDGVTHKIAGEFSNAEGREFTPPAAERVESWVNQLQQLLLLLPQASRHLNHLVSVV